MLCVLRRIVDIFKVAKIILPGLFSKLQRRHRLFKRIRLVKRKAHRAMDLYLVLLAVFGGYVDDQAFDIV